MNAYEGIDSVMRYHKVEPSTFAQRITYYSICEKLGERPTNVHTMTFLEISDAIEEKRRLLNECGTRRIQ